jgi:hypothetical protein
MPRSDPDVADCYADLPRYVRIEMGTTVSAERAPFIRPIPVFDP